MTPQWRGADIMNGLQPVDITFEGPEHGGIRSTTYSTRVVQEACEEFGVAPESTPVVRVASVRRWEDRRRCGGVGLHWPANERQGGGGSTTVGIVSNGIRAPEDIGGSTWDSQSGFLIVSQ